MRGSTSGLRVLPIAMTEYEEDVYNDEAGDGEGMLRLCYMQLEHEGGAFWCQLPLGHAGAHEPPPHESASKRQRAAPKRFEHDFQPVRKERRKLDYDADHSPDGTRKAAAAAGSGPAVIKWRSMAPSSHGASKHRKYAANPR